MESCINEEEAKMLVRQNAILLDPLDRSTYIDIAVRCGLIPEPEIVVEQNEEVTVE